MTRYQYHKIHHAVARFVAILLVVIVCSSCAGRKPVAPGIIPAQYAVSAEDEAYGQEVLSALATQYPISKDSVMINRVRDIADRLTKAAGAGHNQWNVYVFEDPDFKNAAATKGNFIFVWSGLLNAMQNDDELASVIAHEIGHVLAGHPEPTASEEASRITSNVAGEIAGQVISAYDPAFGLLASLGKSLVTAAFEAAIVNPEQRRKEHEADQIGLYLMADAGYNPESAVLFWERVKTDPSFGGGSLSFLSTHPSSEERLETMKTLLPDAKLRYQKIAPSMNEEGARTVPGDVKTTPYRVTSKFTTVWSHEDEKSEIVVDLKRGTKIGVVKKSGKWLQIESPVRGYVLAKEVGR